MKAFSNCQELLNSSTLPSTEVKIALTTIVILVSSLKISGLPKFKYSDIIRVFTKPKDGINLAEYRDVSKQLWEHVKTNYTHLDVSEKRKLVSQMYAEYKMQKISGNLNGFLLKFLEITNMTKPTKVSLQGNPVVACLTLAFASYFMKDEICAYLERRPSEQSDPSENATQIITTSANSAAQIKLMSDFFGPRGGKKIMKGGGPLNAENYNTWQTKQNEDEKDKLESHFWKYVESTLNTNLSISEPNNSKQQETNIFSDCYHIDNMFKILENAALVYNEIVQSVELLNGTW